MTSGQFDTVLAYYNLLNWTAQEPAPPGVSLWDNGQIIPLATSLHMGVIGIRSHAAGALSSQVDRPIPPGTLLAQDVARAHTLDFLLEGPLRTLSQAAMVFCLMNRDLATIVPGVKNMVEIEELVACVTLPPIPPSHLTCLRAPLRSWFPRRKDAMNQGRAWVPPHGVPDVPSARRCGRLGRQSLLTRLVC